MVKFVRLLFNIAILAAAIWFNITQMKLSWWSFTGGFILTYILFSLVSMFFIKVYKNKRGIAQEKYSYSLPDAMAKFMKKVDLRTQYESSILSTFMIMVGLLAMAVYFIFFSDFTLTFKILTAVNSFFGLFFMYSNLVTVYQQYVVYMQTQEMTEIGTALGSDEMISLEDMPIATQIVTGDEPKKDDVNSNVRRDSQ